MRFLALRSHVERVALGMPRETWGVKRRLPLWGRGSLRARSRPEMRVIGNVRGHAPVSVAVHSSRDSTALHRTLEQPATAQFSGEPGKKWPTLFAWATFVTHYSDD